MKKLFIIVYNKIGEEGKNNYVFFYKFYKPQSDLKVYKYANIYV